MPSLDPIHWLSAVLILLAGGLAFILLFRAFTTLRRGLRPARANTESGLTEEKKEKTEFVIDAFSRMVQQLKEKEKELQQFRSLAENRALEAESDNRTLREQMEMNRRLALLGEMSAGIAHEFRNAMGTILGYARLAGKGLPPDAPEQPYLAAIVEEIGALNTIIQDLLNYGKPLALHGAPVDLTVLIRKVMEGGSRDREKPPEVALHLPNSVMADVDEILMRQALTNLIRNALDAMPDGGELEVSCLALPEGTVEIRISDTGPGIPKENREKIFLPFFTTKPKGTGMGLALVQKIVLAHGGRIRVENGESGGTTFVITLRKG